MSDWNEEDEYFEELDEEAQLNRQQRRDDLNRAGRLRGTTPPPQSRPPTADFDNFDPSAYVRGRSGPPAPLDSDEEDLAYQNRRQANLPASGGGSRRRGASQPAFQGRYARQLEEIQTVKQQVIRDERRAGREPGILGSIFGSGLGPGLRVLVFAYGCFGLMFIVGVCGIVLWLTGAIPGQ